MQQSQAKHSRKNTQKIEEKAAKTGLTSPENNYLPVAKELTDHETPAQPEKHRKIIDLKTLNKILNKNNNKKPTKHPPTPQKTHNPQKTINNNKKAHKTKKTTQKIPT